MRLSRAEFLAMNNPVRRFLQKRFEFKIMKQHLRNRGIDLTGKVILDAGCGSGYSSELIIKEFAPSQVIGLDFMPEQIDLAKKRGLKAGFLVGDVTKIELPSNAFDAVFIFAILHHVPEWRKALKEVARVLRQGGVLLVEEGNKTGVDFANLLRFHHPKEARFSWSEFVDGLKVAGFEILERRRILIEEFQSFLCRKTLYNGNRRSGALGT